MRVSIFGEKVTRMGKQLGADDTQGEFIGMAVFSCKADASFKQQVEVSLARGQRQLFFGDIVDSMISNLGTEVHAVDVARERWCEVDYSADLVRARQMFGPNDDRNSYLEEEVV